MAQTVFQRYPCPASLARAPTNNFAQKERPGGGTYQRPDGHGGSDIKPSKPGRIGDPVFPVRDGVVVWAGAPGESGKWGDAYGNRVLLKHEFTFRGKAFTRYSFYAHLEKVLVKKGQAVKATKQLGTMGSTGYVTGPHVHFEWHSSPAWKTGLLDPFPRLEQIRRKQLSAG